MQRWKKKTKKKERSYIKKDIAASDSVNWIPFVTKVADIGNHRAFIPLRVCQTPVGQRAPTTTTVSWEAPLWEVIEGSTSISEENLID